MFRYYTKYYTKYSTEQLYKVDTVITPILQMRTLNTENLSNYPTAHTWQSQDLNLRNLASEPACLPTVLNCLCPVRC